MSSSINPEPLPSVVAFGATIAALPDQTSEICNTVQGNINGDVDMARELDILREAKAALVACLAAIDALLPSEEHVAN